MKKRMKKLSLSRETLRSLDDAHLQIALAAYAAIEQPIAQPGQPVLITDTQTISICKYCTTPIDGCPDPTRTVA